MLLYTGLLLLGNYMGIQIGVQQAYTFASLVLRETFIIENIQFAHINAFNIPISCFPHASAPITLIQFDFRCLIHA